MEPQSDLNNLNKNLMIAQEINFAKVLAGNDKKLRDKGVKRLKKWLAIRSQGKSAFTEDDFQRIWTGLFYCMWMSDKLLVQEELAESISHLIHCFRNNGEVALLFIKCFHKIMNVEWAGLDQYRIDKFNMLSRRFLRQSLEYCKRKDWNKGLVKRFIQILEELVLDAKNPNGYSFHFIDIYLEELAKISGGKLDQKMVTMLLEPFIKMGARSSDARLVEVLGQFFRHLMAQTDVGILYEEKLKVWKQRQFPSKSPEDLEFVPYKNGNDDDDSELEDMIADTALDPRAGQTNTVLPQIRPNLDSLINLIKKYQDDKSSTSRGKRFMRDLEAKFNNLKRGKMSEGIIKPPILDTIGKNKKLTFKSAKELLRFTEELHLREDEDEDEEMDIDEDIDVGEDTKKAKNGDIDGDDDVDENSTKKNGAGKKKVKRNRRLGKTARKKGLANGEKKGSGAGVLEKKTATGSSAEVAVPEKNGGVTVKDDGGKAENLQPDKGKKGKRKRRKKKKSKKKAEATEKGGAEVENAKVDKLAEKVKATTPSKGNTIEKQGVDAVKTPKSPADGFLVEDVTPEAVTPKTKQKRKRTGSSSWLVDDLDVDSEEYREVKVPKIIRLEVKVDDPSLVPEDCRLTPKDEVLVESQGTVATTPLTPVFWEKAKAKVMKKKKSRDIFPNPFFPGDDTSKNSKKISFALDRNEAQENEEYLEEVKNSPSIPFDGKRKPIQSVLKSGLTPSPINPFYRFRKK